MNLVYSLALHEFSLAHVDRVFSHDVTAAILVSQNSETAAILVSQNNETAAMLVSQINPLGVELFSYTNAFFVPINWHRYWPRE